MASLFEVYDIARGRQTVMNFEEMCNSYPKANLKLLREESISIISIYSGGEKQAVINRIKEVEQL